jgi:threonylcarbamoyladenosine tRNA methylthiotransferase MtaB
MDSFSIQNFGCRVNQAEAFAWAIEFQKRGLRLEHRFFQSDLVVVNTCTLTGRADRDGKKFVRRVLRLNPRARVVVTGCLAERSPEAFTGVPGVWKVVPNSAKASLPAQVVPQFEVACPRREIPLRSRPFLKIQDGCGLSCTFCIIPMVRGRSRSVPTEDVVRLVREAERRGSGEIVLAGIHLSSYGQDLTPRSSLPDLLRSLEAGTDGAKVRLSSLDPRLASRPLLECLASSAKICPHFHFSLQHGSGKILRAMGRESRIAEYAEILEFLHRRSPDAALGADIIVGFPGETEEDFRETESFFRESPLSYIHVFPFSPRPGTKAAGWPAVDEKAKKGRAARLRRLSREKNAEFRKRFLGRDLGGVVIEKKEAAAEVLTGNYIEVRVAECPGREGEAARVRIVRAEEDATFGEIV